MNLAYNFTSRKKIEYSNFFIYEICNSLKIFFGYILHTTCFSNDEDDDDDDNIKIKYRSLMLYPYKMLSIGRIVISI